MPRTPRTVSLLALDGAESYPEQPMMLLLCLCSFTEGCDNALFPAITFALETTVNFDVGTLGFMALVQLVFQAAGGPFWGSMASRGTLTRKQILIIGTFFQGLATAIMWMFVTNFNMLLALRAVNGVCLASLRPICNSIVADRFDDEARGKYFGQIMMSLQLGGASASIFATTIAAEVLFPQFPTFWGWKLSFILIGGLTMSLAPLIHLFLVIPPVKVKASTSGKGGLAQELESLGQILKRSSFCFLVIQGCFGLIPWRAFDFRTFFFRVAGLDAFSSGLINACGGLGAATGSLMGGLMGDRFNACWPLHGRVLAAEISVYGGIPIAFATFMMSPIGSAFWYYMILTVALGLIATWTPAACNNPILCALAKEEERSLVLGWQGALEGAVGATGGFIFTWLLQNVFDYNPDCNKPENADREDCANVGAAGSALFWTSCVPWTICGLLYSCLHLTYPKDLKNIQDERESEERALGDVGTDLAQGLQAS